jgi:cysteine synthase B
LTRIVYQQMPGALAYKLIDIVCGKETLMLSVLKQPTKMYSRGFSPHSLEAQVGNTPLLQLKQTAVAFGLPDSVQLYAKAEWFNLSGSVKDRAALHIIRTAEQKGLLWPGMTLLDSTSGNMGIAYAVLGTARGYKVKLALPASASRERIAILRAHGADLLVTDPDAGSDGAILAARELAAADPACYYANQYDNPANWQAYYLTMGTEIWAQTNGRLTHFVAGVGSSGTFTGTTRRLREYNPAIECVAVQPRTAQEGIKGLKHMPTAIRPAIYDEALADDQVKIGAQEADQMTHFLAQREALFVGPSAAAAVAAAVSVARHLKHGVVVTVLPDNGYKYLSD